MDQFPASRRLLDAVDKVPDGELITYIGNIYHITTGNIIAHHNEWSRIMAPAPVDFTELLEWTWALGLDTSGYGSIAVGWGCDEVLFTQLVQRCENLKIRTLFKEAWPDWLDRVLGITQVAPDMEKLRSGFYSELHIRLPLSRRDKNTFETLLALEPFP
jgi:hypothetical protein